MVNAAPTMGIGNSCFHKLILNGLLCIAYQIAGLEFYVSNLLVRVHFLMSRLLFNDSEAPLGRLLFLLRDLSSLGHRVC